MRLRGSVSSKTSTRHTWSQPVAQQVVVVTSVRHGDVVLMQGEASPKKTQPLHRSRVDNGLDKRVRAAHVPVVVDVP